MARVIFWTFLKLAMRFLTSRWDISGYRRGRSPRLGRRSAAGGGGLELGLLLVVGVAGLGTVIVARVAARRGGAAASSVGRPSSSRS